MRESFEEYVASEIAGGVLVRVLEDWCPPFPRILSLLPEPAAAVGRAVGAYRGPSHVDPLTTVSESCLHISDRIQDACA